MVNGCGAPKLLRNSAREQAAFLAEAWVQDTELLLRCRTGIFALEILLFGLAAGKRAFTANNFAGMSAEILHSQSAQLPVENMNGEVRYR